MSVILEPNNTLTYKSVVIGSGPGGSVAAATLAEAGESVLLIEEGPYIKLDEVESFTADEVLKKYRNGGLTTTFGKPKISYAEGRCVGGGSEINSGLYHRTPENILESWRKKFSIQDLDEATLRPHFEFCEDALTVSHYPAIPKKNSSLFQKSAEELGLKAIGVPKCALYMKGKNGDWITRRQTMTETFIPRFLRANGDLLPQTFVKQLKKYGNKWKMKGVHKKKPIEIISENVFINGGAVQTPTLLLRSGIRQNIGRTFQLHPTIRMVAKFNQPVNDLTPEPPIFQIKLPLTKISFGGSVSSLPFLAMNLKSQDYPLKDIEHEAPFWAIYYTMIVPESSGHIRLIPGWKDPLITYNLSDQDLRLLSTGLCKLGEILLNMGATIIFPSLSKKITINSKSDLQKIPEILPRKDSMIIGVHMFASCPMGEDRNACAVDSYGKIHGIDHLYVTDASIIPTALGVNPQGTIMALARRNTMYFLNHS